MIGAKVAGVPPPNSPVIEIQTHPIATFISDRPTTAVLSATPKKMPPRFDHEVEVVQIAAEKNEFILENPAKLNVQSTPTKEVRETTASITSELHVRAPTINSVSNAPLVLPKPPHPTSVLGQMFDNTPTHIKPQHSASTIPQYTPPTYDSAPVEVFAEAPVPEIIITSGDFTQFLREKETPKPQSTLSSSARDYFSSIAKTSVPTPVISVLPDSSPWFHEKKPKVETPPEPTFKVTLEQGELFAPKARTSHNLLGELREKIHHTFEKPTLKVEEKPPTFDVSKIGQEIQLESEIPATSSIFTVDQQAFLNYNDLTDSSQAAPSALQTHLLARKKELAQLKEKTRPSPVVLGAEAVEDEQREKFQLLKKVRLMFKLVLLVILIGLIGVGLYIMFVNPAQKTASRGVEAAYENSSADQRIAFDEWGRGYFGNTIDPQGDNDQDGLTNWEEFLLGSNPTKFSNCENKLSDAQSLFSEIDPGTCLAIRPDDAEVRVKYAKIIDFDVLAQSLVRTPKNMVLKEQSLSQLFNIADISQIDYSNDTALIKSQAALLAKKQNYLLQMRAIAEYVNTNRSYGPYDRNFAVPVHPAVMVDTAIKYNIPLKYIVVLSKYTSKFGTDTYDDSGKPNTVLVHKNMYLLGGSAISGMQQFDTWEEGVDAFGQWYSFSEEKGVVGCTKWALFSTGTDFCNQIETDAAQFEIITKKE